MQQLHLLKSEGQILSDGFGQRSEELHGTQAERWTSWSDGAELPVLTQPGLGVTTTTVTTITQTGGDWSTGLFDVCDDVGTCLVGVCMPCCLEVSLAHQYGECLCLPLLPASTFAMRVAIRERFKIRIAAISVLSLSNSDMQS
ncbi:PLAC8-like protein 1 isoform X3 [Neoarius graeffei]|uniref:PLAC8-like protein 1 isoform X3 n=1 Tax=Neoarius graeffei TaxID=443677 RepID=UPI00298BD1A6|nr:PLAC8-like protein 1 isoform X3 [Neoarius graeffei]